MSKEKPAGGVNFHYARHDRQFPPVRELSNKILLFKRATMLPPAQTAHCKLPLPSV